MSCLRIKRSRMSCPHLSPKPTPCPSPMFPSVTLKVSFHHAGYSSLNHQHQDWWFCWSYLRGSKWCFLVLSDPVVLSDPNPLILSDPPSGSDTHVSRLRWLSSFLWSPWCQISRSLISWPISQWPSFLQFSAGLGHLGPLITKDERHLGWGRGFLQPSQVGVSRPWSWDAPRSGFDLVPPKIPQGRNCLDYRPEFTENWWRLFPEKHACCKIESRPMNRSLPIFGMDICLPAILRFGGVPTFWSVATYPNSDCFHHTIGGW